MSNQIKSYQITDRQRLILISLANGKNKKQIAADLNQSRANVERIIVNLRERFNCDNTTHLVVFCIANEILSKDAIQNTIAGAVSVR